MATYNENPLWVAEDAIQTWETTTPNNGPAMSVPLQQIINRLNYLKGELADVETLLDASITTHKAEANPHPQYLTQAEADTLYTGGDLGAHESAPDPHSQYLQQSEGDARYLQNVDDHTAADDPHPQYQNQDDVNALIYNGMVAHELEANPHTVYVLHAQQNTAFSEHTAAEDPHQQYLTEAAAAQAYGAIATTAGNINTASGFGATSSCKITRLPNDLVFISAWITGGNTASSVVFATGLPIPLASASGSKIPMVGIDPGSETLHPAFISNDGTARYDNLKPQECYLTACYIAQPE